MSDGGSTKWNELSTSYLDMFTLYRAPFFVSNNELQVSRKLGSSYRLYRVFNFPAAPDITVYRGPLDDCLALDAASYRARPK